METNELLARFKQFQRGALILIGILLVTNLVTLGWTVSRLNRIESRLPISVSCSGSSSYTPPPDGVLSSSMKPDLDLAAQGETGVVASFQIASKVPGSNVILAYRSDAGEEWHRVQMTSSEETPLLFTARVPVDMSYPEIEYRLEQVLDGEAVHASRSNKESVLFLLGGSGEVSIDYVALTGTKNGRIIVSNRYGTPKIEAFAIAEVTLKINKTKPELATLKPDSPSGSVVHTFEAEGLKDIEVTVVYADGKVRTTLFNPSAERPREGIYITR